MDHKVCLQKYGETFAKFGKSPNYLSIFRLDQFFFVIIVACLVETESARVSLLRLGDL
jgi:hypothetical protein